MLQFCTRITWNAPVFSQSEVPIFLCTLWKNTNKILLKYLYNNHDLTEKKFAEAEIYK